MYDKYKNIGGGIRQETRAQNTKIKKETNVENEDIEYVDLIGKFKRVELEKHPFIKDSFNLNYTDYKVDQEVLKKIKP